MHDLECPSSIPRGRSLEVRTPNVQGNRGEHASQLVVEQAQKHYDEKEAAQLEKKMASGKFTLDDLVDQLRRVRKMGSMKDLMKKIPGMGDMVGDMEIDEGELVRMEAAIQSMTPTERANPKIIDTSRRRRIARGAGCDPADVSGLVKQFEPMRNMMKAMSGQSLMQRMKMSTQFSKMMMGGAPPKFKSNTTAMKRSLSKKDRRKRRRRT